MNSKSNGKWMFRSQCSSDFWLRRIFSNCYSWKVKVKIKWLNKLAYDSHMYPNCPVFERVMQTKSKAFLVTNILLPPRNPVIFHKSLLHLKIRIWYSERISFIRRTFFAHEHAYGALNEQRLTIDNVVWHQDKYIRSTVRGKHVEQKSINRLERVFFDVCAVRCISMSWNSSWSRICTSKRGNRKKMQRQKSSFSKHCWNSPQS